MSKTLFKSNFNLVAISEEYKKNFVSLDSNELPFGLCAEFLCWVAEALKPSEADEVVFCGGVAWFDSDKKTGGDRWGVSMSVHGVTLLQNYDTGEMWRVEMA